MLDSLLCLCLTLHTSTRLTAAVRQSHYYSLSPMTPHKASISGTGRRTKSFVQATITQTETLTALCLFDCVLHNRTFLPTDPTRYITFQTTYRIERYHTSPYYTKLDSFNFRHYITAHHTTMSPTSTHPTFIHLGSNCTALASMPGYSECTSAFVTLSSAPSSSAIAKLATRSIFLAGLGQTVDGHPQYVNMAIYGGIGFLIGVLVFLMVFLCVRRQQKKKGGKK